MGVPPAADAPGGDALAAQFALIRTRFLAGLPGRRQEIEAAADAAARHAALHRLAGAAGGFGFPALGEMAREAMACGDAGDSPALQRALKTLGDEIDRLVQG